jgi:hypothetical protein
VSRACNFRFALRQQWCRLIAHLACTRPPPSGGNKVRTLEHQLAIVESRAATAGSDKPPRELIVVGSGGSNQVVATVVHGTHRRGVPVAPVWVADPPDFDNTLNMLSTLSFPVARWWTWGSPLAMMRALLGALFSSDPNGPIALPMGGNNPAGVLGQIGGALELAEQIARGEIPDVDGLYVAVGSSCTVSGLIMGVALARQRGLKAFRKDGFRIHACHIHHAFAALHRATGLLTLPRWGRLLHRLISSFCCFFFSF